MTSFRGIRGGLIATTAIYAMAVASPAMAQSKSFNVPAQPAASGIPELARQADVQILVAESATRGKSIKAVRGAMTVEQALRRALSGTGLRVSSSDGRTFTLVGNGRADPGVGQTTTPSGEDEGSSEILVTGSRIRGVSGTGSQTISLNRQDITSSGATTTEQLLRTVPQNFTGGATEWNGALGSGRNGNDVNASMGSGVNLRGLGNNATLVLWDGQRLAPSGLGAFVDISSIPIGALERVEIVADGSSAIYGTDAVGGVVNFILRSKFEGFEASANAGAVTEGHLRQFELNVLGGKAWSTGSLMVNGSSFTRSSLLASDRGYASALATGPSHLIPDETRQSAFIKLRQEVGANLELGANIQIGTRHVSRELFDPTFLQQISSEVRETGYGGTLNLRYTIGAGWSLNAFGTLNENEFLRVTDLGLSGVIPGYGGFQYSSENRNKSSAIGGYFEGPIVHLDGGAARIVVGAERRTESLSVVQAPLKIGLERNVEAVYGEVFVPVFGEANARPGLQSLSISGAARYERYSDFGDTLNPRIGLVWKPTRALALRTSYGRSFRAPYLFQLDQTAAVGYYLNVASPQGPVRTAIILGSATDDLKPETAKNFSAGFDWKQQDGAPVTVGATYYRIRYSGRIAAPLVNLSTIYTDPANQALVARPPSSSVLAAIGRVMPGYYITDIPTGSYLDAQASFDARRQNLASTDIEGLDLLISRNTPVGGGTLNASINASYILKFRNRVTASSPTVDVVDTVFNPVDLRIRAGAGWQSKRWNISLFANYVDSYSDNQAAPVIEVPSWTTVDFSLAYNIALSDKTKQGLSISLSVLNLFNNAPPTIIDRQPSYANPGFDTENGNPLGRYVGLRATLGI